MEILHVFGIHWKLLAAQMVNFSLALFVLHRYVYKPIFAILEKRQRLIAEGLANAEAAAKEKDTILATKEEILRSAREEGGAIAKDLRMQANEAEQKMIRSAQEKSATILGEARAKAAAEREHILRESEKEVARMAVLAAEKILRESAHHA
jgi:F-type H+-transporting ATPase subunit b